MRFALLLALVARYLATVSKVYLFYGTSTRFQPWQL
jgi:hypothetical protein